MTSDVIDHLKVYNYLLKLIFRRKFNSLHSRQMRSEKFKLVSYFSSFMINELLQNFFKTCTVIRNILSVSNLNIQTIVLWVFFLIRKQFVLKLESVLPLAVLDNRVLILKIEKALSIVKKKPLRLRGIN